MLLEAARDVKHSLPSSPCFAHARSSTVGLWTSAAGGGGHGNLDRPFTGFACRSLRDLGWPARFPRPPCTVAEVRPVANLCGCSATAHTRSEKRSAFSHSRPQALLLLANTSMGGETIDQGIGPRVGRQVVVPGYDTVGTLRALGGSSSRCGRVPPILAMPPGSHELPNRARVRSRSGGPGLTFRLVGPPKMRSCGAFLARIGPNGGSSVPLRRSKPRQNQGFFFSARV